MTKPNVLIQLDSDPQPSVFDGIVAIDAGVDHLLRHGSVAPARVRDLVFGGMFTRGPDELRHTAVFIGGSDVRAGEELLAQVTQCFFGPMRVSVMLDANGANTTAAAAVVAAARHVSLAGATALVLAGTGPVGQRVARLLAREGTTVRVGSRDLDRAKSVCSGIEGVVTGARISPSQTTSAEQLETALQDVQVVIAAGAPGIQLLPAQLRQNASTLQIAIDLNAVPPLGVEGIEVTDKAVERDGAVCYGAIGVGAKKMKIHKAAIHKLFTANDQILDADEIFQLGQELESGRSIDR